LRSQQVKQENIYVKNEENRSEVEDLFAKRLKAAQVGRVLPART